jgi:hypothetical protein
MNVDIHVEVEHDLDDEEMDISDHKEEDVVRCLCGVYEDSGLMIQVWKCVQRPLVRAQCPLVRSRFRVKFL